MKKQSKSLKILLSGNVLEVLSMSSLTHIRGGNNGDNDPVSEQDPPEIE